MKEFQRQLANRGLDVTKLEAWQELCELDLVSNVVKHAEGRSAASLRARRPEMFVYPEDRDSPPLWEENHPIDSVYKPLSGDDLYVTVEDLVRYFDDAEKFWRALAEAAEPS